MCMCVGVVSVFDMCKCMWGLFAEWTGGIGPKHTLSVSVSGSRVARRTRMGGRGCVNVHVYICACVYACMCVCVCAQVCICVGVVSDVCECMCVRM